jgi:hypothetical protein
LTLGAVCAAGYFFLSKGKIDLPTPLQLEGDGGVLGNAGLSIPSALARIEQALPTTPATTESALPGRTEAPPAIDPVAANAVVPTGDAAGGIAFTGGAAPSIVESAAAPADSIEPPSEPIRAGPTPSFAAASSPNPQPRAGSSPQPSEAKTPAVRKAPAPAPPRKHTHHRRRP